MENKIQVQESEIAKKLQSAFPCRDDKILTHEDCVTRRGRLWHLRYEDSICYLGEILQDLIKTHSGEPYGTQDLDLVLQFLDIDVVEKDFNGLGEKAARNLEEEAVYIRKSNAEMATKFTLLQAQAIVDWLELARTWPDIKYDLDMVDSALAYWRKRSLT